MIKPYIPSMDCECYNAAYDLLTDALSPISQNIVEIENSVNTNAEDIVELNKAVTANTNRVDSLRVEVSELPHYYVVDISDCADSQDTIDELVSMYNNEIKILAVYDGNIYQSTGLADSRAISVSSESGVEAVLISDSETGNLKLEFAQEILPHIHLVTICDKFAYGYSIPQTYYAEVNGTVQR